MPSLADHARVAVGDAAGAARAGVVGLVGEDELALVELRADVGAAGDHLLRCSISSATVAASSEIRRL